MIERLARYVAIPSVSGGEGPLADEVCVELEQARIPLHRQGNNVWCEVGDAARPRLLLNSHLDTVPPAHGWSNDPWQPQLVDGRLIGLGANDAKGCVTVMIAAVLALKERLAAWAAPGRNRRAGA